MADNKRGRDDQADNADRRQRERDVLAQLERSDETEPPVDPSELEFLSTDLDAVTVPATGADVVAAIGDRTIASAVGTERVADLLPETDTETFDAPEAVQLRVQRPTIARAMKRVVEAHATIATDRLRNSQREAYERTFRELRDIDAVDDDEAIGTIADWIVDRIEENGKLPDSRDVRRQAAKVCRASGYQVRNDEWLGI